MSINPMCERLLVGVSGSIYAMQMRELLMRFRESFAAQVKVIMTPSAAQMVDPRVIELFVDDRVFVDFWDRSSQVDRAPHIQLPEWAELFVIVPATANIIGKAANGIADHLLSTAIISSPTPIVFAPAMNTTIWESKAVQRNIQLLEQDGHLIIPPEPGLSVGSGLTTDRGLGPTVDSVLKHAQHHLMKGMREEYWAEAISTKPLTPAQKKIRELAIAAKQRQATEDQVQQNGAS